MVQPISTRAKVSAPRSANAIVTQATAWITQRRGAYLSQLALNPPMGFAARKSVPLKDPVDGRPLVAHVDEAGELAVCWCPASKATEDGAPWLELAHRIERFVAERRATWAQVKAKKPPKQQFDVPRRPIASAVITAPFAWPLPKRIDRLVWDLRQRIAEARCTPDAHRSMVFEFTPSDPARLDVLAVFLRAGYWVDSVPLDLERHDLRSQFRESGRVKPHSVVVRIAEPFHSAAVPDAVSRPPTTARAGAKTGSDAWSA